MAATIDIRLALVADDDALIRMDACGILEDAGYAAIEATNADKAVAFLELRASDVDLLFTDVDMPGGSMDGFALARTVAERWSDMSILVASGRHKPGPGDIPDSALFVGKPFSGKVVHDGLRQIVPQHRIPAPLRRNRPSDAS